MGATRTIHRLRLTAGTAGELIPGQALVEDGFRIASFPEHRGLLLLRRLDLGNVNLRRSSTVIAQTVEQSVRMGWASAVPITDPGSATASAVVAPEPLEAITEFLRRLAGGTVPLEWFWPSLIRGWLPADGPVAGVRRAFELVLEMTPGPAALAAVIGILDRRGALSAVLSCLTQADGVRLLQPLGWCDQPDRPLSLLPAGRPTGHRRRIGAPTVSAAAAGLIRRWTPADPRSRWLAAMLVLDSTPALLTHPGLAQRVEAILDAVAAGPGPEPGPLAVRFSPSPPAVTESLTGVRPRPIVEPGLSGPLPAPVPRGQPSDAPSLAMPGGTAVGAEGLPLPAGSPDRSGMAPADDAPSWLQPGWPTEAGGLLCVIPLLNRTGFGELLAAEPRWLEECLPVGLLHRLAVRCRVPGEDPVYRWLDSLLPAESPPLPAPGPMLARWLREIRRWCRRHLRQGPRWLVSRPGRMCWTRTHVDLVFPLSAADPIVRRAGLDVDPGWVPWLGRVVAFHYVDGDPGR